VKKLREMYSALGDNEMRFDDKYIDLHIHSMISDGTWSPAEIAKVVKNSGVGIYSITDHDNISGVLDGEKFAKDSNLNYIRGVEISSTFENDWEHILAYGIDLTNEPLNELLKENREKLHHKYNSSIQYLEKEGYNVTYDEFLNYKNDKSRGGFKVLNYLIDKGICTDVKDYLDMFSDIKQITRFPKYRCTDEVIEIIKKAGGVPVLAHPFYKSTSANEVEIRLKHFLDLGVEGIECFHPSHNSQLSKECLEFCKKNKLIITVGSDCHGSLVYSRRIGMHSIKVGDIDIGKLKGYIL